MTIINQHIENPQNKNSLFDSLQNGIVNLQYYISFCRAFFILYRAVLHDHFSLKREIL